MKGSFFTIIAIIYCGISSAQSPDKLINKKEVQRIESILSSDEMQGRQAGKPAIEKAASFIAKEFEKAGLKPYSNNPRFRQNFTLAAPKLDSASGSLDQLSLTSEQLVILTTSPKLVVNERSGFKKQYIRRGDNFGALAYRYAGIKESQIVLVDPAFGRNFKQLNGLKELLFSTDKHVIFILTDKDPVSYEIRASHTIENLPFVNLVGMIPGKSKKDEYVIFSAHYDHLGIGDPVGGDSIYNGANDDAAGTTAMLMLAKYFKAQANNERSLLFVAFTAEESGGQGSKYFSEQMDPSKVVAMFNIEMIGTESKWGKNAAFITGFDETNMGKIMQENLKGSGFTFHPDPYPDLMLFYRSDNATLARLGVPAHTVSTSKMDDEKYYHTPDDELETLDLDNMAMIIKAIALSAKSIISGKDTPSRVNAAGLE